MPRIKVFFPAFSNGKRLLMEIADWTSEGELRISDLGALEFEQVNLPEDSDWVLVPIFLSGLINPEGRAYVKQAHELAKKHQKPLGLFSNSDLIVDPLVNDYYLFSTGTYRSEKRQIELPAILAIDPVFTYFGGEIAPVSVGEKASLGFCGQATYNVLKTAKDFLMLQRLRFSKKMGHSPFLKIPLFLPAYERYRILSHLEKSNKIKTQFIYRSKYRAGANSLEEKQRVEKEFFQNIRDNIFTLCIRGMGNYSVRFFQTLAMGRIPILVDTDSEVPFSRFMPDLDFFLRVPYSDRFRLDEILADYVQSKTEEELVDQQQRCREIWETFYQKQTLLHYLYLEMNRISLR